MYLEKISSDIQEKSVFEELQGEAFINPRFEPGDRVTTCYLLQLADDLGLMSQTTPKSQVKIVQCLSDILQPLTYIDKGLLCWPLDNAGFTDGPYGRDIAANKVKPSLERHKLIHKVAKPRFGPNGGRATIYKLSKFLAPSGLKFKEHGLGRLIEVRDAKPDFYYHSGKPKGRKVSLSQFDDGAVQALKGQMRAIVKGMERHPLTASDGSQWSSCRRIFNNRRLDHGGRVYGDWQTKKAKERLTYTIDREEVCEVDIKAFFLFLTAQITNWNGTLEEDPYKQIPFVRENGELRGLAKVLVSAILSNPNGVKQFPGGKKVGENKVTVPLKTEYALPKKAKVDDYLSDIYLAFPFLHKMGGCAGRLMFMESELILQTMTELLEGDDPIVTYPVHDCLICKQSDEEKVVEVLQSVMLSNLGSSPTFDVEYSDGTKNIHEAITGQIREPSFKDWFLEDDDLILIEDD